MLKRDDVDVVVEATPNYLHAENVVAAAEAGKHIFCEKPMACTNRETEEMLKAVRKAGVKMCVGHNQRFWNQHEIAKELIDSGVIGKLLACRSGLRESYKLVGQFMATDYRWRPEQAGAGALFDLGTHRIDLLRWFAGDIKRVVGLALHQTVPAELDDNVWLMFRFESGAVGSLDAERLTCNLGILSWEHFPIMPLRMTQLSCRQWST
jgi:predicted dehydrogenase